MNNIFLEWFKEKGKFVFGVVICFITSVLIVITAKEFADIVKEDLIYLTMTMVLFLVLFMWYVRVSTRKSKNDKK